MRIQEATTTTINDLWTTVESSVQGASTLEEAAQALVSAVYGEFKDSVVLARTFVTVPFETLPAKNKEWVEKLAQSAGVSGNLKGGTPVLSLIGTRGQEQNWNDRRASEGHVGIPLVSSAFVGGIPMISRLLKELGVPLDWVDSHDSEIIKKTMGRSAGLFYVDDAGQAKDHQGRKIIAAQDFVSKFGVKGVFGIGGAYFGGQILVVVAFCRDSFPRSSAERFLALINLFKGKTTSLVSPTKVFSA